MDVQSDQRGSRGGDKLPESILNSVVTSTPPRGVRPRDGRRAVGVLTVSSLEEDHAHLQRLLGRHWRVRQAHTCGQALTLIRDEGTSVVICDRDLPDGDWKHILNGAAPTSSGPRVIVASRLADERLWAEVLNFGGFDVLLKPFQRTEVLWAVGLAWYDWAVRSKSSA